MNERMGGTIGGPMTDLPDDVVESTTVNATEAGEILGLTAQAVINRVRDGKLPGEKDGHEWSITLKEVYRDAYRRSLARWRKSKINEVRGEVREVADHIEQVGRQTANRLREYADKLDADARVG